MTSLRRNIRQSLSLKLTTLILLFVAVIFICALGYLFKRSRDIVKEEVIEEATHVLDNTALRVYGYLQEAETATNNMTWLINAHLQPDSLLQFSRRVVTEHPDINGCSITMEPDFFPNMGGGFSAYTVRVGNKVMTEREGAYDYYSKAWYKTPRQLNHPCWIDPYDDFNEGTLSNPEMITSYCVPLHDKKGDIIGVIATDLSLNWLSQTVSAERPYNRSYCMMLGADGHYFVHPDTAKLIKRTIFTDADPKKNADIIALGNEMTRGRTGHMEVNVKGERHLVLYRPLKGTKWSVALVCPTNEIYRGYNQLIYVLIPLLIIGLLLLGIGCRYIIHHFTHPLRQLTIGLKRMGEGQIHKPLPTSNRPDVVGQLQNSFANMRRSLSSHITHEEQANQEAEQRSQELEQATLLAQKAIEQKTVFMQDMSHQIRTPLNIIQGFAQVMSGGYDLLPDEDKKQMADAMYMQTHALHYMVSELLTTSEVEKQNTIDLEDNVNCRELAGEAFEAASHLIEHTATMNFKSRARKTLTIKTNRHYLKLTLTELLVNALHFTPQGCVTLRLEETSPTIRFIVEDTGPGIPQKDIEHIFNQFTKLDSFTEGLGLGLYLSRRVVGLLGGTLTLDPTYTNGSRFVIELPLK